jgi:hypothetical protein
MSCRFVFEPTLLLMINILFSILIPHLAHADTVLATHDTLRSSAMNT